MLSMLSANPHNGILDGRYASIRDNEHVYARGNRVHPCIHKGSYFDDQSGLLLDFPPEALRWRFVYLKLASGELPFVPLVLQ